MADPPTPSRTATSHGTLVLVLVLVLVPVPVPEHGPGAPARIAEPGAGAPAQITEPEAGSRSRSAGAVGNQGDLRTPVRYSPAMPELLRLHADHASAVLAFERANRAYFAAAISDRGDAFFAEFADRYDVLLADQEAGLCAFHVLVAEDGSVLGRFNLVGIEDHTAELGYRVAEHAAGRGVATAAVREVCRLAADRHGLRTLRAATALRNAASSRVLAKAGFVAVGPADPAHIGGAQGTWYERDLVLPRP